RLFWYMCHLLVARASEVGPAHRKTITDAAHRVWDRYLPTRGDSDDLAFALGHLLGALRVFDDALRFYELSIEHFGDDHATRFNMALIYHELRDLPAAELQLTKSLSLDPGFSPARALRLRLEEDLGRPIPGLAGSPEEELPEDELTPMRPPAL